MSTPRQTLRRLHGLIIKETHQVVRDPSSIIMAFVLPLILLFLFGYGLSLDADHIRIGLVVEDTSPQVESLVTAFTNSRFFEVHMARARPDLTADLVAGRIRGLVVIPPDFTQKLTRGADSAPLQVITDGSETNTANLLQNYVMALWSSWSQIQALENGQTLQPPITAIPRVWFNPALKSRYFLVPGSIALIMTMIGTLLTALVVAREWERGTMEALMATPVTMIEILAGKLVPYFVLGLLSMVVCVAVAIGIFHVPLRGSLFALSVVSAAFLFPALGMGFLISAVAKNQFIASQMALLAGFLPATLLSGFVYEIDSIPPAVRMLTYAVQARYFVPCLQTIFLAGDIWPLLLPRILAMLLLGLAFFALAIRRTRKRLD